MVAESAKLVGVDVRKDAVRVCLVEEGGAGLKLLRAGVAELPAGVVTDEGLTDRAQLTAAIRRACQRAGVHTGKAALSMPLCWHTISTVTLACERLEQVPDLLSVEGLGHLPGSDLPRQLYADYQVVRWSPETEQMEVRFVTALAELVQALGEAAREAGLEPVVCEPAACSITNLLARLESPPDVLPHALVAVLGGEGSVHVSHTSALVFDRTLGSGDAPLAGDVGRLSPEALSTFVGDLAGQAQDLLNFYLDVTEQASFETVRVAARSSVIEALARAVERRLGVTARLFRPERSFTFESASTKALLDEQGGEFAAALGLALRAETEERVVGGSPVLLNLLAPSLVLMEPEATGSEEVPVASADDLVREGVRLLEGGQMDDAVEAFRRLLEIRPDAAVSRLCASLLLHRRREGDGMRAVADLQVAFQDDPEHPATLALLTESFLALGEANKALTVIEEWARVAEQKGDAAQAALASSRRARIESGQTEPEALPLDANTLRSLKGELLRQGEPPAS